MSGGVPHTTRILQLEPNEGEGGNGTRISSMSGGPWGSLGGGKGPDLIDHCKNFGTLDFIPRTFNFYSSVNHWSFYF